MDMPDLGRSTAFGDVTRAGRPGLVIRDIYCLPMLSLGLLSSRLSPFHDTLKDLVYGDKSFSFHPFCI